MTIEETNWTALSELNGDQLKSSVFALIQNIASEIHSRELDDPYILAAVPRLATLIKTKPELASYREIFSTLARSVGLWNYIDLDHADARDQILAEAVTVPELGGIILHREQVAALNELLKGKNLILSAPTSFGKSLIVDALVASGRYNRLAIVLPTIALLDEFRRRLISRFGQRFPIVMYNSQAAPAGRVIFLGTQERLINRRDLGILDLVVVDEFYKLDPKRMDDRSLTLNAAVYQLLNRSKQFFFLGPNIEEVRISSNSRWRFEFLKTRFSTVAVDTYDLRDVEDKQTRLIEEIENRDNWPSLVFVSSPDRANQLAQDLVENERPLGDGKELSAWFDLNFGEGWQLSSALAAGIGIHHGRIPRALASKFVRLFDKRHIPVLLCTSTLIEGVNTAAKSVLIFDKAINREDYDFFTYSNIKGRAGRLGQHHVGSVYLFHSPPVQQDVEVEPPLFGDMEDAPDELIVHMDEEDMSSPLTDRLDAIAKALDLSPSQLKVASSIGLEDALAIKQLVSAAARTGSKIFWAGYPRYPDLDAVCKIICQVRKPSEFGVRTQRQLTFLINELRRTQPIRDFYLTYSSNFQGTKASQDNIFKFLRSCEYGIPQMLSVIELFAKKISASTDYSLFLSQVPRWFRPEVLKHLDEQGVPFQISERFHAEGDDLNSLSSRLRDVAESESDLLSDFEKEWVLEALPKAQFSN